MLINTSVQNALCYNQSRDNFKKKEAADEGALAVISAKSNARTPIPHDKKLYAVRNIVERFFCKMKDMQELATRFEKKAINLLS